MPEYFRDVLHPDDWPEHQPEESTAETVRLCRMANEKANREGAAQDVTMGLIWVAGMALAVGIGFGLGRWVS
jgi:hypothetical protein